MKNSLLKKSAGIVLTAAVLLSTAGFQAVTVSAKSLGAAHREFVNSSRTNADGHTASSQWRLRDRANTGNFTEDLKTEWQNLCDSFRFRPRDDSASADDMKPIDAIKPFIQNKVKQNAENIKLDDVTNALKSFGRREDSLQDARDNARGNNRFESDNDFSSIKNTVEGYKEKIEGYINTAEKIATFTNSEHNHPFMRWTHYSLKGMDLGTSNIKQAEPANAAVSNMLELMGDDTFTNYMNTHTNEPLDLMDGVTEYADNITYKMMNNTFTPQDIVGPGKDGSQGALTRPLPTVTEENNWFLRELQIIKQLPKDIFNYFFNDFADDLGKMVSKSWNDLWEKISGLFKNDAKKKTGPGDARTLPVLQTAIKPNIYLYPTEEADVEVRFKNPELLTTVIPEYTDFWQATAQPDGSLTVDGEEYGFLFYESDTSVQYMQRNEGWIIKPETRERQLSEIAAQYAFNAQETEDFVTFWCARLESGTSYIMYPQLTETIDALMPVEITPAPDSVFRVWFLFETVSGEAVLPAEPKPTPIERAGFTVTEWGGIVTGETKSSMNAAAPG